MEEFEDVRPLAAKRAKTEGSSDPRGLDLRIQTLHCQAAIESSLGAPDRHEKSGSEVAMVIATSCDTQKNIFTSTCPAAQDQLDSEVIMTTSCSTQSNIDVFTSTNSAAPQDHRDDNGVDEFSKDLQIQQCDSKSPGIVCQIPVPHVTPYEAFKDANPGGNQYCESSKDNFVSFQASARTSIDDVGIGQFASAPAATRNAHKILVRHKNIHRRLGAEAHSRLLNGTSGATLHDHVADRYWSWYTNVLRLMQSQDMHMYQPSKFINLGDYVTMSTSMPEQAASKSVLNYLDNGDSSVSMKEQDLDRHLVLQSCTGPGWGLSGSDSQMSLSSFKAVKTHTTQVLQSRTAAGWGLSGSDSQMSLSSFKTVKMHTTQACHIIIDAKLQHEVNYVMEDCHNVTGAAVTIPEQPTLSGHDYLYNMNVCGAEDAAAVYDCKKSCLVNSDHQARDSATRVESERVVQRRLPQCQADELVQKSLTSNFANHVEASKSLAPELQTFKDELEQSIKEQFQTFTDLMRSQIQSSLNLNVDSNANLKALQDMISHQNLATTTSWRDDFLLFSKTNAQVLMDQNSKLISSWMEYRDMKMETESQTQNSLDKLATLLERESEEIKHLMRLQIKELSSLQAHNSSCSTAFVEQLNACLKYHLQHHDEEFLCKLSHERLEHNIKYENVQGQLREELQQRSGCACKGPSISSFLDGSATPNLLDCIFKSMVSAISALTTCFNSYLNARRDAPGPQNKIISEHFKGVNFARSGHVKVALKAHLSAHMFWGFESETFNLEEPIPCDPMQLSTSAFARFQQVNNLKTDQLRSLDSVFKQYCVNLFTAIIEDIDTSEYAVDYLCNMLDVQNRQQCGYPRKKRVKKGSRPISAEEINLCKSFLPAAQKVWALHKLCLSFEPRATIFRIQRGEMVDWNYMESVDQTATLVGTAAPTVGFMIFPGLRLRNSIIKSEIYLGPPSLTQR